MISSSSAEIASQTRSRAPSNSPRRSRLRCASPGTMLTAPGNASSCPTVPMMWCSPRQMRSTASAASLAPSRASRRMSYGRSAGVPGLALDDAAGTAGRSRSTTPPRATRRAGRARAPARCAPRGSRPARPGAAPPRRCGRGRGRTRGTPAAASCRRASRQRPTSRRPRCRPPPTSRAAPCRTGCPPRREKATTSSANGSGGCRAVSRRPRSSARPRAPSARRAIPSNRPASGTVSRCEPSMQATGAVRGGPPPIAARVEPPTGCPRHPATSSCPTSRIHSAASRFTRACSGER